LRFLDLFKNRLQKATAVARQKWCDPWTGWSQLTTSNRMDSPGFGNWPHSASNADLVVLRVKKKDLS
jgi:hypothetical protein